MNIAKAVLLAYLSVTFGAGYRREVKAGRLASPEGVTASVLTGLIYVGLAYAVVVA